MATRTRTGRRSLGATALSEQAQAPPNRWVMPGEWVARSHEVVMRCSLIGVLCL
jgi:hypothetical protein